MYFEDEDNTIPPLVPIKSKKKKYLDLAAKKEE